jgi:hypothetical protein
MLVISLNFSRDFSRFPGARYKADGPNSAEAFMDNVLIPAMDKADRVILDFGSGGDSTPYGMPSSFCEEAFGGLVRKYGLATVQDKLWLVASKDFFFMIENVNKLMLNAASDIGENGTGTVLADGPEKFTDS